MTGGRQRSEERLANSLPDWESDGSCGVWKYFAPVENKCYGLMFMKGLALANDIASAGATKDGPDSFQSGGSAAVNEG